VRRGEQRRHIQGLAKIEGLKVGMNAGALRAIASFGRRFAGTRVRSIRRHLSFESMRQVASRYGSQAHTRLPRPGQPAATECENAEQTG
jgi:hypothetical protein